MLTKDIPGLTAIPPLSRFVFHGGATLVVYGENKPCLHPGEEIHRHYPSIPANAFPKSANGLRGLVGWIECPGNIYEGIVRIEIPKR